MNLAGKRILLGVAGSIAAYKAADICSQLAKSGADVHVVLTTIPKLSYLPEVRGVLQAVPQLAPFVDAVDGAVQILNQQIQNIAASSSRIAVADFAGLIDNVFAAKKFKVGDVEIERNALFNSTNDPRYLVLADGIHPGTITQGLLANLLVATANSAFGTRTKGAA